MRKTATLVSGALVVTVFAFSGANPVRAQVNAGTSGTRSATPAAQAAFARGQDLAGKGDHAGAVEAYSAAITLDPTLPAAYRARAFAYQRIQKFDLAMADINRYVALAPNDAVAYNLMGWLLIERNDARAAIRALDHAIRLAPQNNQAYTNRGRAYSKLGDHAAAIADYTHAIEIDPNDKMAFNNRGSRYRELGNFDASRRDYQRALQIDPEYALAKRGLADADAAAQQAAAAKSGTTSAGPTPQVGGVPVGTILVNEGHGNQQGGIAVATKPTSALSTIAQAGANLALNRPAQQSSTYASQHFAGRGVDGDRDGHLVFHTRLESAPWWQVDLEGEFALGEIVLYNRTDCCGDRARRVTVWLSLDGQKWNPLYTHDGSDFVRLVVDADGRAARFVRVQLPGQNYLHLAEVEVYAKGLGPTAPGVRTTPVSGIMTGGMPEANVPATVVKPTELPSAFDMTALGRANEAGMASVAVSAMHTLMGPVTAAEEARLRETWSPYFEGGEGLGGPELATFATAANDVVMARGAMAAVTKSFDAAWQEATIAAAHGSEEGVREALALARAQQQAMAGLELRVRQALERVKAAPVQSGAPKLAANKAAYQADVRETQAAVGGAPKTPGGRLPGFVLVKVDRHITPTEPTKTRDKTRESDTAGGMYDVVSEIEEARSPSDAGLGASFRYKETITRVTDRGGTPRPARDEARSGSVAWTPPPAAVPLGYVYKPDPKLSGSASGITPGSYDTVAAFGVDVTMGNGLGIFLDPRGLHTAKNQPLAFPGKVNPGAASLTVHAEAATTTWELTYSYEYRDDAVDADAAAAGGQNAAFTFKRTPEQIKTLVAFHRASIEQIKRTLAADEAELAREPDAERRAALEFRIIQDGSDLQHEDDLIASFQTGSLVHTKSPFDEYAQSRYIENNQIGQETHADFQRAEATVSRLVALFPPDQQAAIQAFVGRQITTDVLVKLDKDKVRQVAQALSTQLQGYWSGQAARGLEEAAIADDYLKRAERVKLVSDVALTVGGMGWWKTGTLGYFGATGWMEGGPLQALTQAAGVVSIPAAVAGEALKGYRDGGWTGAAQNAALAFVLAKAAGYGAAKGAGAAAERLTVKEAMQVAEFRLAQQRGEALVRDFEQTRAELVQARAAMRDIATVRNLERQVADKAAAVQSDLHAKGFLKYRADRPLKNQFVAEIDQIHMQVEANFHALMKEQGWSPQQLRTFRNASSAGSVNMDFDIGLVEQEGMQFLRNGKAMSAREWQQEAQTMWDQAYKGVTGRSAGHALEEVTIRTHPEAYKDLAWIQKGKVGKAWSQQAGDVTRYKAQTTLAGGRVGKVPGQIERSMGEVGQLTKVMEASRGAAKDIETKLLDRLRRMPGANEAGSQRRAQLVRRWEEVQKVLKSIGEGTIDPIHGNRRIRQLTGGYDIPEVIDHAATLLGEVGKKTGR
ncbi:MAG: tetratricopeptide repeat protein [Acidobacteriota bacterium]